MAPRWLRHSLCALENKFFTLSSLWKHVETDSFDRLSSLRVFSQTITGGHCVRPIASNPTTGKGLVNAEITSHGEGQDHSLQNQQTTKQNSSGTDMKIILNVLGSGYPPWRQHLVSQRVNRDWRSNDTMGYHAVQRIHTVTSRRRTPSRVIRHVDGKHCRNRGEIWLVLSVWSHRTFNARSCFISLTNRRILFRFLTRINTVLHCCPKVDWISCENCSSVNDCRWDFSWYLWKFKWRIDGLVKVISVDRNFDAGQTVTEKDRKWKARLKRRCSWNWACSRLHLLWADIFKEMKEITVVFLKNQVFQRHGSEIRSGKTSLERNANIHRTRN